MYQYEATLIEIHDGDTIRMEIDLGFSVRFLTPKSGNSPEAFRFYGYDAAELGRPDQLGEKARDAVIAWFATHVGPYVITTFKDHTEKYGRYLLDACVAADGHELINDQLVSGYLKPYNGTGPKPVWP